MYYIGILCCQWLRATVKAAILLGWSLVDASNNNTNTQNATVNTR